MKRLILLLTVLIAVLGFGTAAYSASGLATMDVSATVEGSCTIETVPILFGPYNVVTGNDAEGAVNVNCTLGILY